MLKIPPETQRALRLYSCGDWSGWSASVDASVPDTTVFRTGLRVLMRGGTVLLAICLNNGYYKRPRIEKLIQAAIGLSPRVTIFFTDGPAKHNYMALGRTKQYALRQTRKQHHQLMNACRAAIEWIRATKPDVSIDFIDWADVYAREDYRQTFSALQALYEGSAEFRIDIREATHEVLSRSRSEENAKTIIDVGVLYSLEELAFLLVFENMVGEKSGVRSEDFAYLYYLRWEIFERLVNGQYDGKLRSDVGFALLSVTPNEADPWTVER